MPEQHAFLLHFHNVLQWAVKGTVLFSPALFCGKSGQTEHARVLPHMIWCPMLLPWLWQRGGRWVAGAPSANASALVVFFSKKEIPWGLKRWSNSCQGMRKPCHSFTCDLMWSSKNKSLLTQPLFAWSRNFLFSSSPSLLYLSHLGVHVLYIFVCVHNIACILLGLYSTDERKHVAFGFLNLANFT
jgi:hypothetical protein